MKPRHALGLRLRVAHTIGALACVACTTSAVVLAAPQSASAQTASDTRDIETRVTHGYANSNGVKIHYAALGDPAKPLVLLIHGFPDYWYTWRGQMEALARDYHAVAMDQRGYNLSDHPDGAEQYDMALLVSDVVAVIKSLGREKAIVIGHDWGGAVAWAVATTQPQLVDKLVILNLPHIRALTRELVNNPVQRANSAYARRMQEPGAEKALTPQALAGWVRDTAARARYVEAFTRSSTAAMVAYYQRNYPHEPYALDTTAIVKVQAPVLMIHGLDDRFLLAGALNGSWEFVERDLTIVTVPHAGHFVQHDAPGFVSRTILGWLARH